MGACFSSSGDGKIVSSTPKEPFLVTLAFPTCPPFSMTVSTIDMVSDIRKKVILEMERRSNAGEIFCEIEGRLVTVDGDSGDTVQLRDNMSVSEAQLEPNQYLWFQDKAETSRVQNLVLRSSRLTDNTSHNSRGVKQGMLLIKEEDDVAAY